MPITQLNYKGVNLEVQTSWSDLDGGLIVTDVTHNGGSIYALLEDEHFAELENLVSAQLKQDKIENLGRRKTDETLYR